MGRERQARLERKEIRQELLAQQRARRRNFWPLLLLLVIGIGGGTALGYHYRSQSTTPAQQTNGSAATKNTAPTENKTAQPTQSTNAKTMTAVIKTDKGDITLELDRKAAPKTVDNFVKLAKEKLYDGTTFHRVIADFMIQGGDPLSKDADPSNDGTGGPGYTFADEINPRSLGVAEDLIKQYEAQGYTYNYDLQSIKIDPGVIAMANSGPNTNGSQFFIVTTQPQAHLYGKHTGFGKVTAGMDVVLKIAQGDKINTIEIVE
ncbi:MAG: peptidylprolyl isomerase [Candidatus Andersenbacteria bacterium]